MFHIQWNKLYNYYHGTKYGASNTKETVDGLQSLLEVTKGSSYTDSVKFNGIFIIGSCFHTNFPTYAAEAWQVDNDYRSARLLCVVRTCTLNLHVNYLV